MGSTAVGRAVDRAGDAIGGTAGDLIKDPKRLFAAAATLGMSEVGNALDNKVFNDPRNKAEDLGARAAEKMDAALAAQQADVATQEMVKERNLQRARTRSMGQNAGGRSSTILTGPLGVTTQTGLNRLLGS